VSARFPEGKSWHITLLTSAVTPLNFAVDGRLATSSYSRRPYFGFFEASAEVPPLPREIHFALDAVHFTAELTRLDLNLEKGDIEFINNLTVLHDEWRLNLIEVLTAARDSSVDSEENGSEALVMYLPSMGAAAAS
jgi:hypothetical protein